MNRPYSFGHWYAVLALWIACLLISQSAGSEEPRLYGMLDSTIDHAGEGRAIGLRVAVIPVIWERFEPARGKVDKVYVREILKKRGEFSRLGYRLQLDLGVQYPPAWIFNLPNARFKNQFGDAFASDRPGESLPNVVFNAEVRSELAGYFHAIFRELGTDWDFVRLGCGKFGELNYPSHRFGRNTNCYWAFDDLAQGKSPGLPEGIPPCPVPTWIPGTPTPGNESAHAFAEWYLEALKNYQNWQIATVRLDFAGDLCLLYGSWGLRPGWLDAAVAGDLNGRTSAEKNGEIQQGFDWSRMVRDLKDPKAIVYCTWVDGTISNSDLADDESNDPARWSPVHWLSSLARSNELRLRIWGENTGANDVHAMALTFSRMNRFGLIGLLWAFERELFLKSNPKDLATLADFKRQIQENP